MFKNGPQSPWLTSSETKPEGVLEEQVGLLDPEGLWVPMDSHDVLTQLPQLPALRVRGARQVYEQSWPEVYATLKASPVKVEEVTEIDWRDPSQVILKTQTLGSVHLGTLNDRLPEKLKALDGLRYLPQEVEMREVEYIDLQNPDVPYLQKRSSEASESPSSD